MGRATEWLAAERPAMVKLLREIERSYSSAAGSAPRGDLTRLLLLLSHVAAGVGGRPRSIQAMRQAWWRWTTHGAQAATPRLMELALIVRHAASHGWLERLHDPDCLSLVDRLTEHLERSRKAERRVREVAWSPAVRIAVEGLVDFLEARIRKRADQESEGLWGAAFPPGVVVQEEVHTMLQEVVERVVRSLAAPREVFRNPMEDDTLIRPFDDWPAALRGMSSELSQLLKDAADEYEAFEMALNPWPPQTGDGPRRANLFGPSANSDRTKSS